MLKRCTLLRRRSFCWDTHYMLLNCKLLNVYQMKQFKVNTGKFFIRNQINITKNLWNFFVILIWITIYIWKTLKGQKIQNGTLFNRDHIMGNIAHKLGHFIIKVAAKKYKLYTLLTFRTFGHSGGRFFYNIANSRSHYLHY